MVYSCRSLIVTVNHYEALVVGIGQGMAELVFCYRINCIFSWYCPCILVTHFPFLHLLSLHFWCSCILVDTCTSDHLNDIESIFWCGFFACRCCCNISVQRMHLSGEISGVVDPKQVMQCRSTSVTDVCVDSETSQVCEMRGHSRVCESREMSSGRRLQTDADWDAALASENHGKPVRRVC